MRKRKIMTCLALMAAFLLSSGSARAADWIESADVSWYEANSADVSFTINRAEELAGLAKLVNDGTEMFEGKTVKLGKDIDLSGRVWTAIGHSTRTGFQLLHCFRGTFDGCGHTVKGLCEIKSPKIVYGTPYIGYIGLFGYCEAVYPAFKNLHIEGNIRPSQADKDAGAVDFYIGGLLGATQTTANGTINKTIENCSFTGKISSDAPGYVGGIASISWCGFLNCYVSADITLTSNPYVGGVVGEAGRGVENCGFTGSIVLTAPSASGTSYVGGVAGLIDTVGSMTNCASFCDMNIKTAQNAQIGGVAGHLWGWWNTITACTGEGTITASAPEGKSLFIGGVAGYADIISFEYCSSAISISASSAMTGGIVGRGKTIGIFTGCEWLGGVGQAEKAVGNIDGVTDEQALKVTEAKNLRAASAILPPIYKITENIPTTVKALVFPTSCGNMSELGFSWGTSNKSALKVASSSGNTAVIRGRKSGTAELYLSASGFPGGNSWSLKAVVLSVLSSLRKLVLSAEEMILNSAGASEEVTASITPESGASYPELKWSYEVVSGDAATNDDLEITYIESTRRVKVTLVNFVEGAQYKLTSKAVDGTDLSAYLTVTAKADPAAESSGGCSAVGSLALLLALPAAFMTTRGRHSRRG